MQLVGQKITLRPARLEDRRNIFNWLTSSDITWQMMGPPDFPDNPIPTWEEFIQDYTPEYFSEENSLNEKSFIISVAAQEIGQINYSGLNAEVAELDIWLAGSGFCNKGYGSDSLCTLAKYLFDIKHYKRCIIAPSLRNKPAVHTYQKCGFFPSPGMPQNFIPDYYDAIVLVKENQ